MPASLTFWLGLTVGIALTQATQTVWSYWTGGAPRRLPARPTLRPRPDTPADPEARPDDHEPAVKGAGYSKGDVRRGANLLQQQAVEAGRSLSIAEAEALALDMLREGLG